MWAMACALYAGCKWLTYFQARARGVTADRLRTLGYLLAWPGMDPAAFLYLTSSYRRVGYHAINMVFAYLPIIYALAASQPHWLLR